MVERFYKDVFVGFFILVIVNFLELEEVRVGRGFGGYFEVIFNICSL